MAAWDHFDRRLGHRIQPWDDDPRWPGLTPASRVRVTRANGSTEENAAGTFDWTNDPEPPLLIVDVEAL